MLGHKVSKAVFAGSLLLLLMPAAVAAETIDFKFKKPGDDKGWKPLSGSWSVSKSGYGPKRDKEEDRSYAVTIFKKEKFSKAKISYEMNVPMYGDFHHNFFARVSEKKIGNKILVSGYYFSTNVWRTSDRVEVVIYRLDEYDPVKNEAKGSEDLCFGEWQSSDPRGMKYKIAMEGTSLKFIVDGKVVCTGSDKTYKNGFVGLIIPDSRYNDPPVALERLSIDSSK